MTAVHDDANLDTYVGAVNSETPQQCLLKQALTRGKVERTVGLIDKATNQRVSHVSEVDVTYTNLWVTNKASHEVRGGAPGRGSAPSTPGQSRRTAIAGGDGGLASANSLGGSLKV